MKKKYLIISISVLLVLSTCLYVFISDTTEKVVISSNKESNRSVVNTNALTMMYETDKTNLSVLIYLNFCYNITGGYYV